MAIVGEARFTAHGSTGAALWLLGGAAVADGGLGSLLGGAG
ncbi:hypothetical protein HX92_3222 [Mycobacterium tuberculosis]|nr:hypothetical protein HX92_3222 [Mycobacterium tuberculosis]